MTAEIFQSVLGWCAIINYAILVLWFLVLVYAKDWVYKTHGRWFDIPHDQFDVIHYQLMGVYKFGIFLLNLIPYLVLRFIV